MNFSSSVSYIYFLIFEWLYSLTCSTSVGHLRGN
jgi:hypothetical protein